MSTDYEARYREYAAERMQHHAREECEHLFELIKDRTTFTDELVASIAPAIVKTANVTLELCKDLGDLRLDSGLHLVDWLVKCSINQGFRLVHRMGEAQQVTGQSVNDIMVDWFGSRMTADEGPAFVDLFPPEHEQPHHTIMREKRLTLDAIANDYAENWPFRD